MNNIQGAIDHAIRTNSALIREGTCKKCTAEATKGKDRCSYCHLVFDFIVRPQPIYSDSIQVR